MAGYTVSSGVTSTGVTLNDGDRLDVLSGGTASGTMVNSGGKVLAQPGSVYGGRAFQDTWRAAS